MNEVIRFYLTNRKYGWMSNLYPAPILVEGRYYGSSEHYYQAGTPKDPKISIWIAIAPTPILAMKAGRFISRDRNKRNLDPEWESKKVPRMRVALRAKFRQNPELREKLLNTGDAIIYEETRDRFWGTGKDGTGKNWHGVLLMETREWLRSGEYDALQILGYNLT